MPPEPQATPGTVEVVRVLDAPRARVFQAWTDPAQAAQWYGPHGYTVPVCELDPRPGGRFRICMRSSKGVECWETGVYREFVPPSRIVSDYAVTFGGHPAVELSTTVTFEEVGARTRVTVLQTFLDQHFTQGARAGTEESLDRLAAHLATLHPPNPEHHRMKPSPASTAPLNLVIRRVFRASPAQVFDAWLDPAALGQWLFATPGGVMERVEVDPRVGGGFTVAERRGDELAEHFGEYLEIDRPHRIAFRFRTGPEDDWSRVTVDFAGIGDRCLLTLTHTMDAQWAEYADRTRGGWTGILHGLAERVLDEPSLTITRTLDAPVSRVFAAWTRPEHLARWWGPANYTTPHVEMDFREGGDWRTCMHGPNGEAYWSGGTYLEIVPDTRLVFTFAWDRETGMDPRNTLVTVLFEDDHGKTRLTFHHAPFVDATDRDNHLGGWSECLDRLVGEFS